MTLTDERRDRLRQQAQLDRQQAPRWTPDGCLGSLEEIARELWRQRGRPGGWFDPWGATGVDWKEESDALPV